MTLYTSDFKSFPLSLKPRRPSPRTGTTGAGIQKYGTQQLKHVAPPQIGTPSQGVIEIDTGAPTRLGFGGEATIPKTPFSQRYQEQRPATIRTFAELETSPHAPNTGFTFEFPDLGDLFTPKDTGCECQACKEGTGQCSDKVPQCDAWDLVCEGTGGATVGVVGGTNYFFWIKIILIVIGIGVLLWLLRPLFGVAKNITEK